MEEFVPDDAGKTMRLTKITEHYKLAIMRTAQETLDVFKAVPDMGLRSDDVMLCSFPKTGTNWLFEIISMVLGRSAQRVRAQKVFTMIDFIPQSEVDKQPSPRVLNSHFPPMWLPKDMKTKRTKTVLCLRNPKDTAVSYYHHVKGFATFCYSGKWENWIRPYAHGHFDYGSYSWYLNEWQQAIEEGVGYPLHVMYYEDMKLNGVKELDKLARFLEVDLTDKLRDEIIEMCSFDKMKKEKRRVEEDLKEVEVIDGFSFFRKGQIGDWKNTFTVAQNEMFDHIWSQEIRNNSMFKFTYEQ